MPRKARSYDKHVPEPDPKYGSVKYAKFINYLMQRGKKNVARKIFYDALEIVEEKMKATPNSAAASASVGKSSAPSPAPSKDGAPSPAKAEGNKEKVPEKIVDGRAV